MATIKEDTRPIGMLMPIEIVDFIDTIAKKDKRSRTGQILYFLEESIQKYKEQNPQLLES